MYQGCKLTANFDIGSNELKLTLDSENGTVFSCTDDTKWETRCKFLKLRRCSDLRFSA
jgi:hypothetical protein